MEWAWFLVAALFLFAIAIAITIVVGKAKIDWIVKCFRENGGCAPVSFNVASGIGFADAGQSLMIIQYRNDGPLFTKLPWPSIRGAEITVSSHQETRGNQSGRTGQSLFGGVVAGPVGAIVGGSGARRFNSKTTTAIDQVSLLVHLHSIQTPIITITMSSLADAKDWQARIDQMVARPLPSPI